MVWTKNGQNDTSGSSNYRYGEIQHFIHHTIVSPENNSTEKHIFAAVKWIRIHSRQCNLPEPLEILSTDFEPEQPATFIPVSRIKCLCAIFPKELIQLDDVEDCVFIVCPMHIDK